MKKKKKLVSIEQHGESLRLEVHQGLMRRTKAWLTILILFLTQAAFSDEIASYMQMLF